MKIVLDVVVLFIRVARVRVRANLIMYNLQLKAHFEAFRSQSPSMSLPLLNERDTRLFLRISRVESTIAAQASCGQAICL